MVNENQESTATAEAPAPEAPPQDEFADTEDANPIISEVEKLNNVGEEEEPAPDQAATPVQTTEAPPAPPAPQEAPAPEQPAPQQPAPDQQAAYIADMQRKAQEYEALRQRSILQQEALNVQKDMESKGYDPEQAQQYAQQYAQSRQSQQNIMTKADEYGQHLLGKVAASEHFAQQYGLGMADLGILRQAETPEVMENLAKQIKANRDKDAELEQLRKGQVPPQRFDNSQGVPEASSNETTWLDRYNRGDRSPQAQAAGRRAAGLG